MIVDVVMARDHSDYAEVRIAFNTHDEAAVDSAVVAEQAFAEIGFTACIEGIKPPMPNGDHEVYLSKDGTDIFGTWTADEMINNVADLRRIFERLALPFTVTVLNMKQLPDGSMR